MISMLTLFVIAASRPVKKNCNTGYEQNEVQIEPGAHKLLANYQTGGYKVQVTSYKFRPMSL